MILSQIASVIVGFPITLCQEDTGSWLVIIVEASLCLSLKISNYAYLPKGHEAFQMLTLKKVR